MTIRNTLASALLALVACLTPSLQAFAGGAGGGAGDDVLEFSLVVCVGPGHTINDVVEPLSPYMVSIEVEDSLGDNKYLVEFEYDTGTDSQQVLAVVIDLWVAGVIVWGENDIQAQAPEGRTDSLWFTGLAIGGDQYDVQYAAPTIQADQSIPQASGSGVTVAIIDTGVDLTHPLFAKNTVPGWDFLMGTATIVDPSDGIDNDGDGLIDEMVGHGTFVASLVRRVARDAAIMPIRILDSDGAGQQYNLASAINWAVSHGADVINLSLGSNGASTAVAEAIQSAKLAGAVVVCAIGNDSTSVQAQYPASDANAFAVAATDVNDLLASFSNYGADVDMCAPGATTTFGGQPVLAESIVGAIPGGGFAIWQGSSFSTAFVSGLAACVRSQHPEWPDATTPATAIADAVMAAVAAGAVDIEELNPTHAGKLGAGRINVFASTQLGPQAPFVTDLDSSGAVGGADLSLFLADWGDCAPGACPSDINRDGFIDGADLSILFANWG